MDTSRFQIGRSTVGNRACCLVNGAQSLMLGPVPPLHGMHWMRTTGKAERLVQEYFPGIHQASWIQRLLDRPHDGQRLRSVLLLEKLPLADADTVLATA
jgi:hypothetical protein